MTRRWTPALLLAGLTATAGCGGGGDDQVLVFAAASLTDVFASLEVAFEAEYPGLDVEVSIAGSSALRLQIDQGAPADVVAVANERVMVELAGEGHVGPSEVFARNSLVIAVPAGNPANVVGPDDLADSELLVGVCAPQVPCGQYALDALSALGISPVPDTEEPDARALTAKIAAGELDVGVIYATDAASRPDDISVVSTLDGVDAVYPIAALMDAPRAEGAALFVDFVLSERGQAVLADAGFGAP